MRRVEILGRNPEWVAVQGLDKNTRVLREVRSAAAGVSVRPIEAEAAGPPRG
jgi:hypothetical protein